jgi:hypothetical protein
LATSRLRLLRIHAPELTSLRLLNDLDDVEMRTYAGRGCQDDELEGLQQFPALQKLDLSELACWGVEDARSYGLLKVQELVLPMGLGLLFHILHANREIERLQGLEVLTVAPGVDMVGVDEEGREPWLEYMGSESLEGQEALEFLVGALSRLPKLRSIGGHFESMKAIEGLLGTRWKRMSGAEDAGGMRFELCRDD